DHAVRYSHPGGVVQATLAWQPAAAGDEEPAHWLLQVADQGIGIAPLELHRVFERNFRGEAARRHRADGTGLGLGIGAALARAHGGQITLQSQPGQGTTALLRLPALPKDNE
ncbi:MAG: ATP-binding protein, partial [Aquincola tertiaricarbonis]